MTAEIRNQNLEIRMEKTDGIDTADGKRESEDGDDAR